MQKNSLGVAVLFILILMLSACGNNEALEANEPDNDSETNELDNNDESNENEANSEEADTFTLRAATAQEQGIIQYAGFDAFVEMIEERTDGRIQIENVGGPEAIPGFNQGEAVMNRTIDMTWIPTGYYTELVPESLVSTATDLSYEELLERGSLDYLSETYEEKMNAKILGAAGYGQFAFFTRGTEINSMEDFTDMQIRGHSVYVPILEYMGNEVITMEGSEIYSALQRGLVDGFGWAEYGVTDLAMEEVIDRKITPTFGDMAIYILINSDAWAELPEDLQEIMTEVAIDSYFAQEELVAEKIEEEEAILTENGVEIVELEDGDEFLQLFMDETWDWLEDQIGDVDHFRDYFQK